MGQVFYDMGFLSSIEVVECSTTDLIGQYVGHTGPKTKSVLERARGRVLFIDEAYRLGEGHFAKEAVDELVTALTSEQYRGKIVVILAGYDQEINDMLAVNPGLSSRFTEEIVFTHMTPEQSIELLDKELVKKRVVADVLKDTQSPDYQRIVQLLILIAQLPSWGNARDLKELARRMVIHVFTTQSNTAGSESALLLSGGDIVECIAEMYSQRMERAAKVSSGNRPNPSDYRTAELGPQQPPPPPSMKTSERTKTATPPPPPEEPEPGEKRDGRDPGVSDAVWEQLERDRRAQEEAEEQAEKKRKDMEEAVRLALQKEQEEIEALQEALAAERAAKDEDDRQELMRQRELLRLRQLAAAAERAERERMLALQREAEEKRRKEEAKVQRKIRELGMCVAGFKWIKQPNGYRCAGGSHFLDNATLGI
jgi:hypothetical protein